MSNKVPIQIPNMESEHELLKKMPELASNISGSQFNRIQLQEDYPHHLNSRQDESEEEWEEEELDTEQTSQ